jgi:hypothetical protein
VTRPWYDLNVPNVLLTLQLLTILIRPSMKGRQGYNAYFAIIYNFGEITHIEFKGGTYRQSIMMSSEHLEVPVNTCTLGKGTGFLVGRPGRGHYTQGLDATCTCRGLPVGLNREKPFFDIESKLQWTYSIAPIRKCFLIILM